MKSAPAKKAKAATKRSISKREISDRLIDIDVAQTSAIRDLELDVSGAAGSDSKATLRRARKAIA